MISKVQAPFSRERLRFCIYLFLLALTVQTVSAQTTIDVTKGSTNPSLNRERGLEMLKGVKEVIKELYYDSNFHGINLDERFKLAAQRIKTLETNGQISRVIAQVLVEFNDSHTRFFPPNSSLRVEYGFSLQMIGNRCYVVSVKKGSDAEAKGLKVGDLVTAVNDYVPTRENMWKMQYLMYSLEPQKMINLTIRTPDDKERQLTVDASFKDFEQYLKERAKIKSERRDKPYKCSAVNPNIIACKLYTFAVDKSVIDKMMKEVGSYKKVILDLRGNGGGFVKTEMYLTGYFFDRDVKIGDEKTRESVKEKIAKTLKEKAFSGDLVVLIDSNSASAAEVFSRVMQIEKRAKVIGDISAGMVMTSNFIPMSKWHGTFDYGTAYGYAVNITVGDLIMSDGKRLENVGVIPDVIARPNGKAIALKVDATLSYATAMLGSEISPEKAGELHFMVQKSESADEEDDDESEN